METTTPREIDVTRRRGPLLEEEKQQHHTNHLCLYCGRPGHIAINCPNRPRRKVNHINTVNKPYSNFIGASNNNHNINSPTLSNRFEVLTKHEEENE